MLKLLTSNCFHHISPLTKDDIFILVGMALERAENGFSCMSCVHYQVDCADDYGFNPYDYCEHPDPKIACCGNLKSFPFKNAPERCFRINPWLHPFIIGEITEYGEMGEGGRYEQLKWLARGYNQYGIPRLRDENKLKCREAYADFCLKTGFKQEAPNA